jgi:hypothetical protein
MFEARSRQDELDKNRRTFKQTRETMNKPYKERIKGQDKERLNVKIKKGVVVKILPQCKYKS